MKIGSMISRYEILFSGITVSFIVYRKTLSRFCMSSILPSNETHFNCHSGIIGHIRHCPEFETRLEAAFADAIHCHKQNDHSSAVLRENAIWNKYYKKRIQTVTRYFLSRRLDVNDTWWSGNIWKVLRGNWANLNDMARAVMCKAIANSAPEFSIFFKG